MADNIKKFNYPSSCAGDKIQPVFKRLYDEDRKMDIVQQDGEIDLYESIQESNNTSDITLLKRAIAGDPGLAPEDPTAVYADSSIYPNNIHELYGSHSEFSTQYNLLPDSVKKIFPSVEAFKSAVIDGSYTSKVVNGLNAQAVAIAKANEDNSKKNDNQESEK